MSGLPSERPAVPLDPLKNLWAGAVSALVFYAEYLGLGATLGSKFFGETPTASSLGALLVLLAVVVAALLAWPGRAVFLAGPRGASVAILGGLSAWLGQYLGTSPSQQVGLVGMLLVGAALTLLAARHPKVQGALEKAPLGVVQGFMYATATLIVCDAVFKQLYGCLQVSELTSWAIFLPTVIVGVLWKPALSALAAGPMRRTQQLLKLVQPMGLPIAAGVSWCAYEATVLALPHADKCKRLGDTTLDWSLLSQRAHQVLGAFAGAMSPLMMVSALAAGVALGVVLLIESLTAFAPDGDSLTHQKRTRLLEVSTTSNLVAACVGGSCSSYSSARTVVLRNLGATHPMASLAHGLTVAAIAMLAGRWVAQVPSLTVAVALTLVGVQMIGEATQTVWREAYHPRAPLQSFLAGVLFWAVVLASVASGHSLVGLVVGTVLAWASYKWIAE